MLQLEHSIKEIYNNLAISLRNIVDEKEKLINGINEKIKDITSENKDFQIDFIDIEQPYKSAFIAKNENEKILLPDNLGSGYNVLVAFALFSYIAEKEKTPIVLIIDEPELHLHSDWQKKMYNVFSTQGNLQIVYSTHSSHFVKPNLVENVFKFENTTSEGIKILPKKEDQEKVRKIKDNFLNLEVCEIFFAQKVLCVEGKTDLNSFQKYLLNIGVNFSDWIIVKMNSKDEAKKFWNFLKCFGLEFKIVLDLDALFGKQKNREDIESETNTFKNFFETESIKDKIISLGKCCEKNKIKEERCSPLFNENLNKDEIKIKNEILEELKEKNVFILQQGMLENYLDKNGEIVEDKKEEKDKELKNIFNLI